MDWECVLDPVFLNETLERYAGDLSKKKTKKSCLFVINHIKRNVFSSTIYLVIFLTFQQLWQPSCNHDGMGAQDKPDWLRMAERKCGKCQSHLISGFFAFWENEFCLIFILADLGCCLQSKAFLLIPIIFFWW